ncbi:hypothetical protein KUCAC02_006286, partial [Chaenocephalus aceratus]
LLCMRLDIHEAARRPQRYKVMLNCAMNILAYDPPKPDRISVCMRSSECVASRLALRPADTQPPLCVSSPGPMPSPANHTAATYFGSPLSSAG